MIKKTLSYVDFNGNNVEEDFYFNLTKAEALELELTEKDGLSDAIKNIVAAKDGGKIVSIVKRVILMSHGERSSDGRRFVKNDEIRDSFQATEAYSELFIELSMDPDKLAEFINGLVPGGLPNVVFKEGESDLSPSDLARKASEANMQGHQEAKPSSRREARQVMENQLVSDSQPIQNVSSPTPVAAPTNEDIARYIRENPESATAVAAQQPGLFQ